MDEYGHLVLTTETSQIVKIGKVTVKICRVRGKYVLLSIHAPKSMQIRRGNVELPPDETDMARSVVHDANGETVE